MNWRGRFDSWVAMVCVASALQLTCSLARAQSSVTLYGNLDVGLLYTSKTYSTSTRKAGPDQFSMVNGGMTPSIFGITGYEDLGGGTKAIFKLESGVNLANGGFQDSSGGLFGREAWVGLANQYGQVRAGLQESPFFKVMEDSDVLSFGLFGAPQVNYSDNAFATGTFVANAVSYMSPNLAGFKGSAMLALGGVAGNFQAGRQYSASLEYNTGSFMINAGFFDGNGLTNGLSLTNTSLEPFLGRTLGIGYYLGGLTVKGSFTSYKVAQFVNYDVYNGGLLYAVSPALYVNGEVTVTSDRDHTQNHSVMGELGTEYYLSKRTSIYGEFGVVNNRGLIYTGLQVNNALYARANGTTLGAEIGMRHTF